MIYRLQNPKALDTVLLDEFLSYVFPEDSLAIPGGYRLRQERFKKLVRDEDYAIFVGVTEGGELKGLALVYAPAEIDWLRAQILHFHNEGDAALRAELVDACVEFARQRNHLEIWAINATEKAASVWARMFRRAGTATKVGDIMRVEFK